MFWDKIILGIFLVFFLIFGKSGKIGLGVKSGFWGKFFLSQKLCQNITFLIISYY